MHRFVWAVAPEVDLAGAVEAARLLSRPDEADAAVPALAGLELVDGHAVVDWVKLAEDGSGDVIVRVYETRGGRARARLERHPALAAHSITETDLLERPAPVDGPPTALRGDADDAGDLELGPYQVCTLRLAPSTPGKPRRRNHQ